jgi:hypothetical protein
MGCIGPAEGPAATFLRASRIEAVVLKVLECCQGVETSNQIVIDTQPRAEHLLSFLSEALIRTLKAV